VSHQRVGRVAEGRRCEGLTFGVDDLYPLLLLRLGLPRHRALRAVRELDVLQLQQRHLDTPLDGRDVQDLENVHGDVVRLGWRLVPGVLADDLREDCFTTWPP